MLAFRGVVTLLDPECRPEKVYCSLDEKLHRFAQWRPIPRGVLRRKETEVQAGRFGLAGRRLSSAFEERWAM